MLCVLDGVNKDFMNKGRAYHTLTLSRARVGFAYINHRIPHCPILGLTKVINKVLNYMI